jgi:outer membrane protein assembly factor BamA
MRGPVLLVLLLLTGLAPVARAADAPRPERYEFGGTPVITGDSDIGFGFGALVSLARFRPGFYPYRWRAEILAMMTVKDAPDGGAELPYHDYYLKLDLPGLAGGRLRLNVDLGFSRHINCGYYGMGNVSPALDEQGSRYHQYDRIHPQLRTAARVALLRRLFLLLGGSLTYNWITPYRPSRLDDDIAGDDPHLRDLLRGTADHGVVQLSFGWLWDSRDHELAPTRGMLHEITWRFVPGTATEKGLAYGGLNLTARIYHALLGEHLVLAGRLLLDLLVGQPPFYELAAHGGLFPKPAPGGATGIRGVPLHRYHGKVKLLANIELRSKLLPFTVYGQRFNLGAMVFCDTGRVWADLDPSEELDGTGVGLKVGLGGGLRLQWGETFLLRGDVAWSPDARPVGIYVDVNHVF